MESAVKQNLFSELSVIWVGKLKYQPDWHVIRHVHDFAQLLYVVDGEGWIIMDDSKHTMGKDMLFLIAPGCRHEFESGKTSCLKTIEVKFIMDNRRLYDAICSKPLSLEISNAEIRNTFESMLDEALSKEYLYKDTINLMVFSLLFKLARLQNINKNENAIVLDGERMDCTYKGMDLKKILVFIEENYNRAINLNDLSRMMNDRKPSYLCKIFKEKFNITIMQYINNLRLNKAKELLAFSELNISQVSEMVGFATVHYFSRFFKQRENISPIEYKSKVRDNIYVGLEEGYYLYGSAI